MKLIKLVESQIILPLQEMFLVKEFNKLLKIMEGTVASIPPQGGRKHPQQEFLNVNTSNILFICGGAFSGLEKIISKRGVETGIGFRC